MWQTLLKFGGTAAQALSPWMIYLKVAVIAAVIGVVSGHLWGDHRRAGQLNDITQELGTLKQTSAQALHTLGQNKLALTECLSANAWNAQQAKDQEIKAVKALANVRRLEELNARSTEDIHREEATLRNRDQECRTADQPLPDWILPDSLWDN